MGNAVHELPQMREWQSKGDTTRAPAKRIAAVGQEPHEEALKMWSGTACADGPDRVKEKALGVGWALLLTQFPNVPTVS